MNIQLQAVLVTILAFTFAFSTLVIVIHYFPVQTCG